MFNKIQNAVLNSGDPRACQDFANQLYAYGADIEEVCDRAKEEPLLKSIKLDKVVPITQAHLNEALKAVKPYVDEELLKLFEKFEKKF